MNRKTITCSLCILVGLPQSIDLAYVVRVTGLATHFVKVVQPDGRNPESEPVQQAENITLATPGEPEGNRARSASRRRLVHQSDSQPLSYSSPEVLRKTKASGDFPAHAKQRNAH